MEIKKYRGKLQTIASATYIHQLLNAYLQPNYLSHSREVKKGCGGEEIKGKWAFFTQNVKGTSVNYIKITNGTN